MQIEPRVAAHVFITLDPEQIKALTQIPPWLLLLLFLNCRRFISCYRLIGTRRVLGIEPVTFLCVRF